MQDDKFTVNPEGKRIVIKPLLYCGVHGGPLLESAARLQCRLEELTDSHDRHGVNHSYWSVVAICEAEDIGTIANWINDAGWQAVNIAHDDFGNNQPASKYSSR